MKSKKFFYIQKFIKIFLQSPGHVEKDQKLLDLFSLEKNIFNKPSMLKKNQKLARM